MPLLLLAIALLFSLPAGAVAVEAIVDPRPSSHIVDLTDTLDEAAHRELDTAASKGTDRGELIVVVVDSTDGVSVRSYATSLFNRFALDSSKRKRGVLLFVAVEDRTAEIVVGDGFGDDVTKHTEAVIGDASVRFKRDDPRNAIVVGAHALVDTVIVAPLPVDGFVAVEPRPVAVTGALQGVRAVGSAGLLGRIVDLTQELTAADRTALAAVQRSTSKNLDLVVVVVKDTAKATPHDFALATFDELGLDKARHGRGLLLLAVTQQRQLALVHGAGFPRSTAGALQAMTLVTKPATKTSRAFIDGVVVAARSAEDIDAVLAEERRWLLEDAQAEAIAKAIAHVRVIDDSHVLKSVDGDIDLEKRSDETVCVAVGVGALGVFAFFSFLFRARARTGAAVVAARKA